MVTRTARLRLTASLSMLLLAACGGAETEPVGQSSSSPSPPATSQPAATPTANQMPVVSGTPATSVAAGASYSFQVVASDPEGARLTFTIQNKPAWATFDAGTGRLHGTPSSGDVGTSAGIAIGVSDGTNTATLPAFSITVTVASSAPPNRPPTVTGSPATSVQVGAPYAFQPVATDPDSTTLSFSIQNKPAWLTFTASNGRLSGTPTAADVGTSGAIVISVTDGQNTVPLPAFSVTVTGTTTGSATINWTAPTQRQDGSGLSNLAGYKIYYGTSPDALSRTLTISNPGLLTAVIDSLTSGTWYFAVKTYDAAGVESNLSNLVNVRI